MNVGSLFCDTKLARRIERAEVDLIRAANSAARRREAPGFLTPVAGGVASFADHGSPYNKVTGLGFDGVPDGTELDLIELAFAAHGASTQVELAHLDETAAPVSLPDVDIRRSPDDEFETWLAVMADAAAHADTDGLP